MRKSLLLIGALSVSLFLASCGKSTPQTPEKNTSVTEATTQAAEEMTTEAAEEMTTEETTSSVPANHAERREISVDFDKLSDISNSSEEYGFSNKWRDKFNRPEDLEYYDAKYGDYSAINHIDTEEKIIYLTMDEGYENGCTPAILDTLKEKGVKVTFFVTKQFYDEYPELIQRMIDEGHVIGNHTCAHPASGMPSLGAKKEYEDIKKLNDLVYDTFGYQMSLFRFPQGNASKQACALLQQMGYTSVFWSFAYGDYDPENEMDPTTALDMCLEYTHPGAIYLLHAISKTNTSILADFIDGARSQGYEFGVLEEALNQ
ncbi:MAG: polysaccharide deacetylase family protein [Eubacteriales bacterium]|nr:polysaccharide deacetylase family protein [Eubacteriales bacterium]